MTHALTLLPEHLLPGHGAAGSIGGVTTPAPRFGLVLPVKRLAVAKSRLAELGDDLRRELVTAFVLDTVTASVRCPAVAQVLVVTDEIVLARAVRELGADAIPDGRPGDLNATVVQGVAELLRRQPHLRPAAMCADLPAARPGDLTTALERAAQVDGAAFVADEDGTGTTLYTAPDLPSFTPHFGEGSRAAHLASGATQVDAPVTVRLDVDTPEQLGEARHHGVGAHTARVLTMRLPARGR